MLSQYFNSIVNTEGFKKSCNKSIEDLQGKKVLIYGAGEAYRELEKIYKFKEKLNIVGIADLRFQSTDKKILRENKKLFKNINTIDPKCIPDIEFDMILLTNEHADPVLKYLKNEFNISEENIKQLFVQEIQDESINLSHLHNYKFSKTLPKLIKKLKGKKVMLYGAGSFLKVIKKYYDISGLDIVGIADNKYSKEHNEKDFLGYKTYSPDEIKEVNPDYVVVSTKYYIDIILDLYDNYLKDTKIKIRPLVHRSFWTLFKEATR